MPVRNGCSSVKQHTAGKGHRVAAVIVGCVRALAHIRDQQPVGLHGSKGLFRKAAGRIGGSASGSLTAPPAPHGQEILTGFAQARAVFQKPAALGRGGLLDRLSVEFILHLCRSL